MKPIEVISALISVLALAFSYFAFKRTRVSEDKRRKLEVATHLQEYYCGIRVWGE